jgi:hydrogenase maturation protease
MTIVPTLGGSVDRILVVGCQPAALDDGIGLSPEVAAAVGPAVTMVGDVVRRELDRISAPVDAETTGHGA